MCAEAWSISRRPATRTDNSSMTSMGRYLAEPSRGRQCPTRCCKREPSRGQAQHSSWGSRRPPCASQDVRKRSTTRCRAGGSLRRRRPSPQPPSRRRAGEAAPRPARKVVDLTHTMSADFPTFDGTPGIEMQKVFDLKKDGYNLYRWGLIEHSGTHLDAPIHFSESGMTVEQIPPRDARGAARRDQRGGQGGEGCRLPALTRRPGLVGAPARAAARQLLRRHEFRLGAARRRQRRNMSARIPAA